MWFTIRAELGDEVVLIWARWLEARGRARQIRSVSAPGSDCSHSMNMQYAGEA